MISVIIPALNEEKYISKCIEGVKSQAFKDYEVIIVDGKSSDKTIEVIKKISNYKVIISDKRNAPYQRNLGAKYAKGDFLIFTDAVTILSPNAFYEINKLLKENQNVAGGSITGIFEPIDFKVRLLNCINPFVQKTLSLTYAYCIFARKSVFESINGFKDCVCEDSELGERMKKYGKVKILFNCSYISSSRRFKKIGFYFSIWTWVIEYFKNKFGIHTPLDSYALAR